MEIDQIKIFGEGDAMRSKQEKQQLEFELKVRSKKNQNLQSREIQQLISAILYENGYDFLMWEKEAVKVKGC